jgi:hypothetical protein
MSETMNEPTGQTPVAGPTSETPTQAIVTEAQQCDRRGGDRRGVVDRRVGLDRRRGPGRRRQEDRRSAEEGEMTAEQFEFLMAMNEYKRVNRRPFPTWTEVLDVMKALGYRKVAQPQDIQ